MNIRPLMLVSLGLLTLVVVLAVLVAAVQRTPGDRPTAAPAVPVAEAPAEPQVLGLLRDWDTRRSRAWARGDMTGLGRLYLPGSRTGRQDRAMLAAYVGRGLTVSGIRMQVLTAAVRTRTADRISVRVTDRMTGAVAVGRGVEVRLPTDRASTRVVELRRVSGEWLVAEVRDQASRVASTDDTSRSWNR